ncbi:MAG TPA: PQQ-dependent sugar dehydrogenase [Thermoanaerobaculia bacterium]|nr:PQQ-dependent sugar dehydrogenase [Thermoanaerobaculia bacterium]
MIRSLALSFVLAFPLFAAEPIIVFEPVATDLDNPVSITHAGDSRLFITEQDGLVRIYDGTRMLPEAFLDLRSLVSTGGERGLLSVAFHPDYAHNGFFFVNYTDVNGDTVVARYSVSTSNPNRAEPASVKRLLFVDQPYPNHNGGQLQFGPDGYLYIGMGDGGSAGDPENRAQDRSQLLGKMLRIDVNAGGSYAIPPSNPYASNSGNRGEIWAYGLRNPWRFSFDRASGDLWIADVGQGSWEEIDLQRATSIGGENYGWDVLEGTHCFGATSCTRLGTIEPVIEYNHSGGACSVTGGYVYRGTRSPRLEGMYLYGDYCNGRIWGARNNGTGWSSTQLADTTYLISTFGEDVNGEIYVADHKGAIYRIVDSVPLTPKRRAVRQ